MILKGLQKTTLLDFPGKLACTVFTGGCNFRCPFCHNASLVTRPADVEEISLESFFSYISKRSGLLDGVCITGGEPLLNKDIDDFIKRIRELGLLIKLDTNGAFPERLEYLLDNGLVDYVAMDIKNSPEKYAMTAGIAEDFDISLLQKSIDIIIDKAPDYEFRTTVVRELHTEADFVSIGTWLTGARACYLQAYRDSEDVLQPGFSCYSYEELLHFRDILRKTISIVEIRGID